MNGVELDRALEDLEPLIVRGQLNQVIRRLVQVFDEAVEAEGVQAGRRLIELVNLVAGERRKKVVEVEIDRRAAP